MDVECAPTQCYLQGSQDPFVFASQQTRPGQNDGGSEVPATQLGSVQDKPETMKSENNTSGETPAAAGTEAPTSAQGIQAAETATGQPAEAATRAEETAAREKGDQAEPQSLEMVSLERKNAFVDEAEAPVLKCQKCNLDIDNGAGVVRGPCTVWCRECHCLYTMLNRHQQWPPAEFVRLDEIAQQRFFAKCKQEREESKKSSFSYKKVRDTLVTSIVEDHCKRKTISVGGTYLPISVYEARGYKVDAGFKERNPCQWSDGLNDWTYMLAECSVNEDEITNTVEKAITAAENMVRKRKKAIEEELHEAIENTSTAAAPNAIMDLVTDSDTDEEKAKRGASEFF